MDNKNSLLDTIAITLKYDESMNSPLVTAKGTGLIAQQIINIAKENDIPLQQNSQLVELLSQVKIDEQIPETLYEAVAQVLIFAYQLSEEIK